MMQLDVITAIFLIIGVPVSIWLYWLQLKLVWNSVSTFKGMMRTLELGHTPEDIAAAFKPFTKKKGSKDKEDDDVAYENMYR